MRVHWTCCYHFFLHVCSSKASSGLGLYLRILCFSTRFPELYESFCIYRYVRVFSVWVCCTHTDKGLADSLFIWHFLINEVGPPSSISPLTPYMPSPPARPPSSSPSSCASMDYFCFDLCSCSSPPLIFYFLFHLFPLSQSVFFHFPALLPFLFFFKACVFSALNHYSYRIFPIIYNHSWNIDLSLNGNYVEEALGLSLKIALAGSRKMGCNCCNLISVEKCNRQILHSTWRQVHLPVTGPWLSWMHENSHFVNPFKTRSLFLLVITSI